MRLPTPVPAGLEGLEQHEIEINGVRVAYTEAGEGPPVLLLHGAVFGGNVFWWENQVALADTCHTYAPDFPGWGASAKPPVEYTMAYYHAFITSFLEALGLDRVAFVGHSMGGLLASSYALTHPERVASLTAIAVPPAWASMTIPPLFQPFTWPLVGELVLGSLPWLGPDSAIGIRRFYEGLFHAPASLSSHRLRQALAGCCEATADPEHRHAFLSTLRANQRHFQPGARSPFRDSLHKLTFPTLLIAGRQDRLFPLPLIERGAALAPQARLEVLDACGHFPQWEQREQVEILLRGFATHP